MATLLNCLTGQSSAQSPKHSISKQNKAETPRPITTPFNISSSKANGAITSPTKLTKESVSKDQTVPVITDYDTGIHASLIYRKCNSLPRARAPKIFVNNLHNFSRSPEKHVKSVLTSEATLSTGDKCVTKGYLKEHKCCNTVIATSSSGDDFLLARASTVCLACSAASHKEHQCHHEGVPKRSKSFCTVSYITGAGGGCPCTVSHPPPGISCSLSATKPKSCSVSEPCPPLTSSGTYSTSTAPVVFSKASKACNSGELFLL